jgi:hypothetical protein
MVIYMYLEPYLANNIITQQSRSNQKRAAVSSVCCEKTEFALTDTDKLQQNVSKEPKFPNSQIISSKEKQNRQKIAQQLQKGQKRLTSLSNFQASANFQSAQKAYGDASKFSDFSSFTKKALQDYNKNSLTPVSNYKAAIQTYMANENYYRITTAA